MESYTIGSKEKDSVLYIETSESTSIWVSRILTVTITSALEGAYLPFPAKLIVTFALPNPLAVYLPNLVILKTEVSLVVKTTLLPTYSLLIS